jgi:hypothetical protein
MSRYIWAFAAIALAILAIIGFTLLVPTAERPSHQSEARP